MQKKAGKKVNFLPAFYCFYRETAYRIHIAVDAPRGHFYSSMMESPCSMASLTFMSA